MGPYTLSLTLHWILKRIAQPPQGLEGLLTHSPGTRIATFWGAVTGRFTCVKRGTPNSPIYTNTYRNILYIYIQIYIYIYVTLLLQVFLLPSLPLQVRVCRSPVADPSARMGLFDSRSPPGRPGGWILSRPAWTFFCNPKP